jgi:predicted phage terminase large subunit-like protein
VTLLEGEFVTYSYDEVSESFDTFCKASGIRNSALTEVLTASMDPEALNTSLGCVAYSTPPQEGKTTWIVHYIAWQLIRNPWLKVVYATYSQARANAVSRQIRGLVAAWSPLASGSSSVQRWETQEGGGLLAAGRGSAMTGFRSDMTVIDDPIKDMQEAQSQLIRETTVEWFQSVVVTRMASLSQIIVIATRWHKDDLIAHVVKELDAAFLNVPAQATYGSVPDEDGNVDILGREVGEWLPSVQNRSKNSWLLIKKAVGTYVWQSLYQGDPKVADGGLINVDKMDIMPWQNVVFLDDRGFMQTLGRAIVIQSWDLTFGTVPQQTKSRKQQGGTGDYVAGHVYVVIGEKWILVDRVHGRFTFTQTLNEVQKMAARWPQTSRIYVEKAANGAAVIDSLKKRAALIKPVSPKGSKEARALAVQPIVDQGNVAILDTVLEQREGMAMLQEFRDFPFGAHDDDVDAFTQALNNGRADYFQMRN